METRSVGTALVTNANSSGHEHLKVGKVLSKKKHRHTEITHTHTHTHTQCTTWDQSGRHTHSVLYPMTRGIRAVSTRAMLWEGTALTHDYAGGWCARVPDKNTPRLDSSGGVSDDRKWVYGYGKWPRQPLDRGWRRESAAEDQVYDLCLKTGRVRVPWPLLLLLLPCSRHLVGPTEAKEVWVLARESTPNACDRPDSGQEHAESAVDASTQSGRRVLRRESQFGEPHVQRSVQDD